VQRQNSVSFWRDNEPIGSLWWDGAKVVVSRDFDQNFLPKLRQGCYEHTLKPSGEIVVDKGKILTFDDGKEFLNSLPLAYRGSRFCAVWDDPADAPDNPMVARVDQHEE